MTFANLTTPTQRAVAILAAAAQRNGTKRTNLLHDGHALIRIRRKVASATLAALEANTKPDNPTAKAWATLYATLHQPWPVGRMEHGVPPTLNELLREHEQAFWRPDAYTRMARPFSRCYPASTGADTCTMYGPSPVACDAQSAATIARSYLPEHDIDRLPAIRALQALHLS
jgi:hypothetical protein